MKIVERVNAEKDQKRAWKEKEEGKRLNMEDEKEIRTKSKRERGAK